jgi:hypothetical protein
VWFLCTMVRTRATPSALETPRAPSLERERGWMNCAQSTDQMVCAAHGATPRNAMSHLSFSVYVSEDGQSHCSMDLPFKHEGCKISNRSQRQSVMKRPLRDEHPSVRPCMDNSLNSSILCGRVVMRGECTVDGEFCGPKVTWSPSLLAAFLVAG